MVDVIPLVGLVVLAWSVMIYPIRHERFYLPILITILFTSFVVFGYLRWGGWDSLRAAQMKQAKMQQARELLQQYKTPEALIQQLKQKVAQVPQRARGWYLLGRLYASQQDWVSARQSFEKAVRLKPTNEQYEMNWINAAWNENKQRFSKRLLHHLHVLLKRNPKQPDALAMLAMNAYQQKQFREAIQYWEVLLTLTPPDSDASEALRKAIAKAQRDLQEY